MFFGPDNPKRAALLDEWRNKPVAEWSAPARAAAHGYNDGRKWKADTRTRFEAEEERAAYGWGFSQGRDLAEGIALGN